MEIIKDKNNPDSYIYLFIILLSGGLIIYLQPYTFVFLFSCFVTVSICIFLYLRTFEISLDKGRLKIKLFVLAIPYKIINIDFDHAKFSGPANHILSFYKDNIKTISFNYEDDYDDPSYTIGYLAVYYNKKSFDLGNKKTSFNLFEKIKSASSKYFSQADT